jgi:hypothetical protein
MNSRSPWRSERRRDQLEFPFRCSKQKWDGRIFRYRFVIPERHGLKDEFLETGIAAIAWPVLASAGAKNSPSAQTSLILLKHPSCFGEPHEITHESSRFRG